VASHRRVLFVALTLRGHDLLKALAELVSLVDVLCSPHRDTAPDKVGPTSVQVRHMHVFWLPAGIEQEMACNVAGFILPTD
jgi:hypothetical protein